MDSQNTFAIANEAVTRHRGEPLPTYPQMLPLNSISLPAQQARRYFDPEKMEQLTQSVKNHGLLENLIVRPLKGTDNKYELIVGERRYRAAQLAVLEEVPVTVREVTDKLALQLSLEENLHREDLNPVEETEGILQLLAIRLDVPTEEIPALLHRMHNEAKGRVTPNVLGKKPGQVVQAVFKELGMTWKSFVTTRLPLLKLPADLLEELMAGKIAYTKAHALAKVKEANKRQALLLETLANNLSVNQIHKRIQALSPKSEQDSPSASVQEAKTREQSSTKAETEVPLQSENGSFNQNKASDHPSLSEKSEVKSLGSDGVNGFAPKGDKHSTEPNRKPTAPSKTAEVLDRFSKERSEVVSELKAEASDTSKEVLNEFRVISVKQEKHQQVIVFPDARIKIEGSPNELVTLLKQIQSNPVFAQEVIQTICRYSEMAVS